jgi:peptidoglycan/xylan/chitin deacetylase (PgdA/CDA1 family)/glycosyltransferase involved in cell wall biosynthesis
MRLLFISNVFPNPFQTTKGVFNRKLVQAIAADHEIEVISPISWVDECMAKRRGSRALSSHRLETVERVTVYYPRYYYPPKIMRQRYGWFLWRSLQKTIRQVITSHRPHCVLGYWVHPDGEVAVRTARLAGVPAIVMVGGSDVLLLTQNRNRHRCIVQVLQDADAIVTVSRDLKSQLVNFGIPGEKIYVVYRGIDVDQFFPGSRIEARKRLNLSDKRRLLLWVGRMVPVKGLDVLIEACGHLQDRGEDYHLALIGNGPLQSKLEADIQARRLVSKVSIVGNVDHDRLPDWYRAADLTVLPSRSEGVPNVLRESLACGTPFVASRVGGIPEIAEYPDLQLVPPEDGVALADGILRSLNSERQTGLFVEKPASWQKSAEGLIRIVQTLVNEKDPGRRDKIHNAANQSNGVDKSLFVPNRFRQMVRKVLAATFPRRMILVRGPTNSKVVCLTFDDGPHPEYTARVLDALKEQKVTATFFVVGQNAEKYPDLVKRMADEGHLIGHHSFSHTEPGKTSARELLEEIQRTRDLLRRIVGCDSYWFRPPHGKLTVKKLWGLCQTRQTVVLWNADPKDYARSQSEEVWKWFQDHPLQGGDVVLMHDNCPHAARILPALVTTGRERGLSFETVDKCIK